MKFLRESSFAYADLWPKDITLNVTRSMHSQPMWGILRTELENVLIVDRDLLLTNVWRPE